MAHFAALAGSYPKSDTFSTSFRRAASNAWKLSSKCSALHGEATPKLENLGWTFAHGDKVMQIKNDYDREVYNGDIRFIAAIAIDEADIIVRFDGQDVTYGVGDVDALVPAYAASINKAQGSEFPPW